MPVLGQEDQTGGLGAKKTPAKIQTFRKKLPKSEANPSSVILGSPGDGMVSIEEGTKPDKEPKQKLNEEEKNKEEYKSDIHQSEDDINSSEDIKNYDRKTYEGDISPKRKTQANSSNQERCKAKLYNHISEADQRKEIEKEDEESQRRLLHQQRIWQKQEEDSWLEKDLAGPQKEVSPDVYEVLEYKEENKYHAHTVKIEPVEISKPTIGDMRMIWEKKFVQLMNQIESLESISINNRTKQEEDALKKMRKKYHKKRKRYQHLARAHLSEPVKKIVKKELCTPNMKSEESNMFQDPPSYFGVGTNASPIVKFYFTAPCPQLGIEAGCEPFLEGRPAFLASQLAFTCSLCQLEVTSGLELVEHWRGELERLGEQLVEEQLDVPHAEVRPAQVSTNKDLEVKMDIKEENVFKCTVCHYRSNRMNSLQRHIYIVHSNEMSYCDQCEFKCTKKDTLRAHRHRKHRNVVLSNEVLFCEKCEFKCTKKDILRAHRNRKHTNVVHSNEVVYCDQCEFKCAKKDTLRTHRNRKHKNVVQSNEVVYCEQCEFKCTKRDTLRAHRNRKHKYETSIGYEALNIKCDKCEYSCTKDKVLVMHNYRKHNGFRPEASIKCDECEYSCFKSKVLSMHKYRKHNGVRPPFEYECNLCDYKCSKGEQLSIHLFKKHNGDAPQSRSCDNCEYTTPWTSRLRTHMDKHNGKKRIFYCDQCDFGNKNKLVLRHHETLNHGIEATVLCDLCDFKTSSAGYLKAHTTMKHSDNVFMCDQCSFKSTYVAALKNHTRIHDKLSWLQCESCSYRTPAKGNLKIHNESKHMGIRHPCKTCKFVGYNKAHLKLHTDDFHLGTAPSYKCDYCDYSHSDNSRVKKHKIDLHKSLKSEQIMESNTE